MADQCDYDIENYASNCVSHQSACLVTLVEIVGSTITLGSSLTPLGGWLLGVVASRHTRLRAPPALLPKSSGPARLKPAGDDISTAASEPTDAENWRLFTEPLSQCY